MYNMGIYLDFGHHFSIDGLLSRSKNVDFRTRIPFTINPCTD